jgi:uncharacterized protein YdaU (DUF1376 family)
MSRAWMPLYVGDYLRDTRDLNTLQHGAYLLLIMHYWQHDALPTDDARLAAIAGLTVAQWRRIREPVQAKFGEGWKHKRIDAELARLDRAVMQRRLAGRSGGIKSGIARAVARGEAIICAQAEGKRALARRSSARPREGEAAERQPRTNHNQKTDSSLLPLRQRQARDGDNAATCEAKPDPNPGKPASQWSRGELDALFARRGAARAPDPPSDDASDASHDPSNARNGG